MNPDREKVLEILSAALELASRQERDAFLRSVCAGDHALHAKVVALLTAYQKEDEASKELTALDEGPGTETILTGIRCVEAAGAVIDRYKLVEPLGEGGMGTVWIAEQFEPVRRRVALKVIRPGMDSGNVLARFDAERQALALMDHGNIAKVFDAGTTPNGRPYFVMELVKGIPITTFCDEKQLSIRERLELFIQVCQAIQHAHQKGIIHRDIKPSNVLVALYDGIPVPKVIDFGIAKATGQRLTQLTLFTELGALVGTPEYMSPEQAELNQYDIDTRSDIYSLGVLLYELLTGTTPLTREAIRQAAFDEILRRIRAEEPAKPSTRVSSHGDRLTTISAQRSSQPGQLLRILRGDLDWIVLKALEKERTRRYESANSLAADLARHLTNQPVLARPPSVGYALQKAFRRNKVLFTATAGVALALIFGAAVSTWQAVRAFRARTEAEKLLYVANMNLAQQAAEQKNMGRLQQLLRETQTYPNRGFEWFYWQTQIHGELMALRGHSNWITSVAFSPDGRRLITGSLDTHVKVWDASSGKELLTLTSPSSIRSFALSRDGRRIATGAHECIMIWDPVSGEKALTLQGHSNWVTALAFSPDGKQIVSVGADKTVKVWDLGIKQERPALDELHATIGSVAFSPNGQQVATAVGQQDVVLWDPSNGRRQMTLSGHLSWVTSVNYSSDGERLVTGSLDQTIRVWNATTGEQLLRIEWPGKAASSAVFSADGRKVLAGSSDATAAVWETSTGRELLKLTGHIDAITAVAFSADGRRILTGSADGTAKVWAGDPDPEPFIIQGQDHGILAVGFSQGEPRVVTGRGQQRIKVWDVATRRELFTAVGHSNSVLSADFSQDGQKLVTASADRTAKVWDIAQRRELFTLIGHEQEVESVAMSHDGQWIVTGSSDQTAKVWDGSTGRGVLTLRGHKGPINSTAFSAAGRRIVTGSSDGTIKVWSAATGRELLTMDWPRNSFNGLMFSVAMAIFSPDARQVLAVSYGQPAKLWDVRTGRELFTLKGHRSQITAAGFSPDGRRLITGSVDETVKIWDASCGRELLTLKGHRSHVTSMAFSADGRCLLTGGLDGMALTWRAASPEQVARWHQEESEPIARNFFNVLNSRP
ncbi:MAG: serine/threonine-protein kinase [Verrucomicrobiota bacterium]